jgi:iron uptake system component EfeO
MPHFAAPPRARIGGATTVALVAALLAAAGVAPARAETLEAAAERYRPSMIEDVDQSLAGARKLRDCVAAADVAGAKKAWLDARVGWERAEVFTSAFVPDLDREIDAWPNALMGFHAIEARLFGANAVDVRDQTDALIFHLEDLSVKVHHIQLLPQRLLNGTARLAYEVGESKADGGESRFSGTSLDDMRNNLAGIDEAFKTIFALMLAERDPPLAAEVQAKIDRMKELVEVPDLKHLEPGKLRAASEELVLGLQRAAPALGLRSPTLEEIIE